MTCKEFINAHKPEFTRDVFQDTVRQMFSVTSLGLENNVANEVENRIPENNSDHDELDTVYIDVNKNENKTTVRQDRDY